jgi:hypothetical protein
VLIAGCGVACVLISHGERWRREHVAEYYALLAAAGAGMAFFVQASNLMTLFLGLEWFSIALYIMCAIDIDLAGSLEAGLKYLIRWSAWTCFRRRRYGPGELGFPRSRPPPATLFSCEARDDSPACVQGLAAVPHVTPTCIRAPDLRGIMSAARRPPHFRTDPRRFLRGGSGHRRRLAHLARVGNLGAPRSAT